MFTEFLPRPALLATELLPQVAVEIPTAVAITLADELGEAHLKGKRISYWYGDAVTFSPNSRISSTPFAMQIDDDGYAIMLIRPDHRADMAQALSATVPHMLIAEPLVSMGRIAA